MKKLIHPRYIVLYSLILFASIWRILSSGMQLPLDNINPVGAMALFGGCYFANKWIAFIFPLLTLLLGDIIIMQIFYPQHISGFLYEGWLWVYVSFTLVVSLGFLIRKISIKNILLASITAAAVHWFLSNLGVWISGNDVTTSLPFTKTWSGFIKCYALALPFLKNTLIGNILFSTIMFGCFEFAKKKFIILKSSSILSHK